MLELFIGKVIFAVLITEFELRRFSFTKSFLEDIKFTEVLCKTGALIIVAFIDRAVFAVFPEIKGMVTMRAPKFGFVGETAMEVK